MSGLSRRTLLKQGIITAGALLATGCVRNPTRVGPTYAGPRLPRVNPARDRVIRTMAGLRPFRPSGFVVQAAKYGDKLIIHNYGHGGGGISLSWGSSTLAADLADGTSDRKVAVIGSGVMGLCTARVLQDRGYEVTIYTKLLPPQTTSNIAGGQWSPASVHDAAAISPAYLQQFERAARIAHRYFQYLVGDQYGVRWIDNYVLRDALPTQQPQPSPIADLMPAGRNLEPGEHPFAARHARVFKTMLIEPSRFLRALLTDYLLRGGKLIVRELRDLPELLTLNESTIMNCSGLGSKTLFGDQELLPIKGQLVFLLPQPEIDYILVHGEFYMFPRSDGILLGGSRERGEWSTGPTAEVVDRILAGHQRIFQRML